MTTLADDIAAEITARIAQISIANGYQTDIGLRLFQGRRRIDESHIPCAVIVEGEDSPSGQQNNKVKIEARYAVEGIAPCDPDNPNIIGRAIVADLKQAIWGSDPTFGRRVQQLQYLGRTIAPREDGISNVAAAVEFAVIYPETLAPA